MERERGMTRPITVMEWLCYSWLHTAVCSHSHSPPVQTHRQRQRHAAFQPRDCCIHLSHKIEPLPSDNIAKNLQHNQNRPCHARETQPPLKHTHTLLILEPESTDQSSRPISHTYSCTRSKSCKKGNKDFTYLTLLPR